MKYDHDFLNDETYDVGNDCVYSVNSIIPKWMLAKPIRCMLDRDQKKWIYGKKSITKLVVWPQKLFIMENENNC